MYIEKIVINNFKCFEGDFSLNLNDGLNIIVGDNEAGKSTILEAINLSLSGWIYGKYLSTELTQSLFNANVINKYLESLKTEIHLSPPEIVIEVFFQIEKENDSLKAIFEGNYNSTKQKACGIKFSIYFNEKFQSEYDSLLSSGEEIISLPIEFYEFAWSSFARDDRLTPKSVPFKSHLIDSSNNRYQNGSDVYITRIIRDVLTEENKTKISQAHRKLKDIFARDKSIEEINQELEQKNISDKKVELSVDLSTKTAWENNLVTCLNKIPFCNIGRGEQCLVKTKLSLSHKKAQEASILLLEEPENHLSHSKLNKLIGYIKNNYDNKQIVISTHSSFVANKLGLKSLILLSNDESTSIRSKVAMTDLSVETREYFEKLPGYDTLRMLLCKKAILVEGPSDELIVQRAYKDQKGNLPIEGETDVISVGTSFLRFLEIAEKIKKPVVVVTDNDKDFDNKITKKYKTYETCPTIKICADNRNEFYTLEPQIIEVNKSDLKKLREILKLDEANYQDQDSIIKYMIENKTESALKIFNAKENIKFPQYILNAINWEYEQK